MTERELGHPFQLRRERDIGYPNMNTTAQVVVRAHNDSLWSQLSFGFREWAWLAHPLDLLGTYAQESDIEYGVQCPLVLTHLCDIDQRQDCYFSFHLADRDSRCKRGGQRGTC